MSEGVKFTPGEAWALLLASEWIAAWMRGIDRDDWMNARAKLREAYPERPDV